MADVRDNPGGGTAGDGTVLLERILADGRLGTVAFSSIFDPQAVALCHAAGEGSTLQLRFGGKTSHLGGQPIDARVNVRRTLDDTPTTFMGRAISLGRSAHVSVPLSEGGVVELVLNDRRLATTHPDIWDCFELDVSPSSRWAPLWKQFPGRPSQFQKQFLTAQYIFPIRNHYIYTQYFLGLDSTNIIFSGFRIASAAAHHGRARREIVQPLHGRLWTDRRQRDPHRHGPVSRARPRPR